VTVNDDIATPSLRSKVAWQATGGQDYFVLVSGSSATTSGPFVLTVTSDSTPVNDLCSGAIDLTSAAMTPAGATAYGDTTGYASNLNPPIIATCTGAMTPGPDAIYRVDAAANGTLMFELTPTDWDGAVYVLDGCSGSANCLGGADMGGDGSIDSDMISVTPGTYYVVVDSQQPSRAGCLPGALIGILSMPLCQ